MFMQAAKRVPASRLAVRPFPAPQPPKDPKPEQIPFTPIWHFKHDAGASPAKVTELTCLARGMGMGRMGVCSAITYEGVRVVTSQGTDIDLPLTPDFVIHKSYLKQGAILKDQHFLYPLPAEIDVSMLTAFGYEFPQGPSGSPVVIPQGALSSNSFMPTPSEAADVGAGQHLKVTLAPLRVLVLVSLVTAMERADFEPGGLLGAGRVWPHVMIMGNRDLAEAHAVIHVERPKQMQMSGGDHTKHKEMNSTIEAALYADTENPETILGSPSPFWHQLFDAFDVGVSSGTIRAVDPAELGGPISGAIQRLDDNGLTYAAGVIERVAGQGAYDNIHVAPTMSSAATPVEPPDHKLKRIFMAPFCEHDCLHTHWRWSSSFTPTSVHGWAETGGDPRIPGTPYRVPGAPMVPANQSVDVESTGPSSFKYRAKAVGRRAPGPSPPIPAGTFSTFFHHGMAYAVVLDSGKMNGLDFFIDAEAVRLGEPDLGETASFSTAIRYWRLRFSGDDQLTKPNIVNERLKVIDRAKVLARVP